MDLILAQASDVTRARLDAFMRFLCSLIRQVHDHLSSAMPTWYAPILVEKLQARLLC